MTLACFGKGLEDPSIAAVPGQQQRFWQQVYLPHLKSLALLRAQSRHSVSVLRWDEQAKENSCNASDEPVPASHWKEMQSWGKKNPRACRWCGKVDLCKCEEHNCAREKCDGLQVGTFLGRCSGSACEWQRRIRTRPREELASDRQQRMPPAS